MRNALKPKDAKKVKLDKLMLKIWFQTKLNWMWGARTVSGEKIQLHQTFCIFDKTNEQESLVDACDEECCEAESFASNKSEIGRDGCWMWPLGISRLEAQLVQTFNPFP